jgi:TolB-like protein
MRRDTVNRQNFIKAGFLIMTIYAALTLFTGCGGPRTYIHPEVDMSYYEAVGVLPFRNLTNDRLAAERVTNAFVTELLIKKVFEVVEPGQFRRTARQIIGGNIDSGGEWDPEKIRELGSKTGVQGLIVGAVREYEMVSIGQTPYPLVTIDVKLIDIETARVAWMISHTEKGGPNLPILSVGETYTLGKMTQIVCEQIVGKIKN